MQRRALFMFIALLPLATAALAGASDPAPVAPVRLRIEITGLRNDNGSVALALFKGPTGFPDSDEKAVARKVVAIAAGAKSSTVTFDDIAPGADYAVSLLHDENNNGKLDTSFGFPVEGFGFSNNPRLRMGPPRFKDAAFVVLPAPATNASGATPAAPQTITVKMVYLGGF